MNQEQRQSLFQALAVSFVAGVLVFLVQRSTFVSRMLDILDGLIRRQATVVAVMVGAFALYAVFHYSRQWISSRYAEAIVVSALVFEHGKVLLVKEESDGQHDPWLLPPGAHWPGHRRRGAGPQQAVINEVKDKGGVDIQIDAPAGALEGTSVSPLPKPTFVQSEHQLLGGLDSHKTHHNYYYIGHLAGQQNPAKVRGNYEWISVNELRRNHVPREMIEVIQEASKSVQQEQ